ncbi:hypothetical protein V1264_010725 [Littorina saxatilis]
MPSCVSVATQQPHRCCKDDSKQKNRGKNSKNKNTEERTSTKASGPAVNLLERDLQDILSKQHPMEKIQGRSTLQSRMDLLLSLGCTMEQIQRRVQVLNLSEQIILKRATLLKDLNRSPITVSLLLSTRQVTMEQLVKHLQLKDEADKALCTVLRCSATELVELKAQHPSLERVRNVRAEEIFEKEKLLLQYGITTQEIRDFPGILKTKTQFLQERLDTLTRLREKGKLRFERYPLFTLADRTRTFDQRVKNALVGRREIDGSHISLEVVAERLGATPKDVEDASFNFLKLSPSKVIEKIDYFLEQGISKQEILSHIYIMRYRQNRIVEAVKQSKIVSGGTPSIYIILSFLRSGRLPRRSFVVSRQRTYVAMLLGVNKSVLPLVETRPLWSSDRIQIKRNYDFLLSQGFSVEDILSCVILLAHDPDCLKRYYRGLWERPEVDGYGEDEAWKDKKKVLALLQYVIERDMNFTSIVFVADVEYEHGSAIKDESHDLKRSS